MIGFELSTKKIAIIEVMIILIRKVKPPIVGVPVFSYGFVDLLHECFVQISFASALELK